MSKTSIVIQSKNTCNTYFRVKKVTDLTYPTGRSISGIILVIQLHLQSRNVNFKVKGAKI